jgi:hypothetical protein
MANEPCVFKFGDFEVREREFLLVKAGEVLPVEAQGPKLMENVPR